MRISGPAPPLRGVVTLPGDKSISHRALLHAALSPGTSQLRNCLRAGVTEAMIGCLRQLGVTFEESGAVLVVRGGDWRSPTGALDCGNSGTTLRLLLGALANKPLSATLTGTPGLRRRPLRRVAEPLRQMGAQIEGDAAPLLVHGRPLRGIEHATQVASAQVKAALLLAALGADGPTTIREPGPSRDHSERMLRSLGVDVRSEGNTITLFQDGKPLPPTDLTLPGDFSSASFLIAAALLVPESDVRLAGVGVNPTRTGLLEVLRGMGAELALENQRQVGGEPVADIVVRHGPLRASDVRGDLVVRMIDEFPVLAVVASQAAGTTTVRDAAELRKKESDRISAVAAELRTLGVAMTEYPDGFAIDGPQPIRAAMVDSHADHRLAMSLAVAGLLADGETVVARAEAVGESFPGFAARLLDLGATVTANRQAAR